MRKTLDLQSPTKDKNEEIIPTIFTKAIIKGHEGELIIVNTNAKVTSFKNILSLPKDRIYGDVFIAWNDNPHDYTIFFGTKGNDFED